MDSILQQIDWHQLLITILTLVAGSAAVSKFKFGREIILWVIGFLQDRQQPDPVPIAVVESGDVPVKRRGSELPAPAGTAEYLADLEKALPTAPAEFVLEHARKEHSIAEASKAFIEVLVEERKQKVA